MTSPISLQILRLSLKLLTFFPLLRQLLKVDIVLDKIVICLHEGLHLCREALSVLKLFFGLLLGDEVHCIFRASQVFHVIIDLLLQALIEELT